MTMMMMMMTSRPGPCHSWVRALGGSWLANLELHPDSRTVDMGGGVKNYPMYLFMNISSGRALDILSMGSNPPDF